MLAVCQLQYALVFAAAPSGTCHKYKYRPISSAPNCSALGKHDADNQTYACKHMNELAVLNFTAPTIASRTALFKTEMLDRNMGNQGKGAQMGDGSQGPASLLPLHVMSHHLRPPDSHVSNA
jgi:hypothetical protein